MQEQPQYDLSGNIIDNEYELSNNKEVNYDLTENHNMEAADNCYEEPSTGSII